MRRTSSVTPAARASTLALERQAREVARGEQQQHDHDGGAERDGDQPPAHVILSVVEGRLGGPRLLRLVGREPLRRPRRLLEDLELGAEQDPLRDLLAPVLQRVPGARVEPHEVGEPALQLTQQPALARLRQTLVGLAQVAPEVGHRTLEDRSRGAVVVAPSRLPAVHVGHAELQLERERPVGGALLDLVEAVVQRVLPVQRDGDRRERPQHRQRDREIQLRADRHGGQPAAIG